MGDDHPLFPRLPGESHAHYRWAHLVDQVKALLGLGAACPGCRTRPGHAHRRPDCPQHLGVNTWH